MTVTWCRCSIAVARLALGVSWWVVCSTSGVKVRPLSTTDSATVVTTITLVVVSMFLRKASSVSLEVFVVSGRLRMQRLGSNRFRKVMLLV